MGAELISRRSLITGILGLPFFSERVLSENSCGPLGCTAQVPFLTFAAHYENQYQSEWCWAACISMVFGSYGHPVDQQRIVTEAYGAPYNMPAGSGLVIAGELNRSWVDDNGRSFNSTLTAAFDAQVGVGAIDSSIIVAALENGDPLIVGSQGHATVLTEVVYVPTPAGPSIVSAGVFDPWPGRGPRNLTQSEMLPFPLGSLAFLALANIT